MQNQRVPSDVLKVILSFLGAKTLIKMDLPKICKAVRQIAEQKEYRRLFKDYIFDDSKDYPRCHTIYFLFNRLQKSELIIARSDEFFEITPALAITDDKKLFTKEELILLENAAELFLKILT